MTNVWANAPSDFDLCLNGSTGGTYRTDHVRTATGLGGPYALNRAVLATAMQTFWTTFQYVQKSDAVAADMQPFLRICGGSVDLLQVSWTYQAGMGLVPILTAIAAGHASVLATGTAGYGAGMAWASSPTGPIAKIDLYVALATSGAVRLYIDGVLALSYAGDLVTATGGGGATSVEYSSGNTQTWYPAWISEVVLTDADSRDIEVYELAPTAAGALWQWTGAYTAVSGTGLDGVYISAASAGLAAMAALTALPLTSASIMGVGVVLNGKVAVGGPQSLGPGLYLGSHLYQGDLVTPTPAVMTKIQQLWTVNPATGGAWLTGDLAGLQAGVVSGP